MTRPEKNTLGGDTIAAAILKQQEGGDQVAMAVGLPCEQPASNGGFGCILG